MALFSKGRRPKAVCWECAKLHGPSKCPNRGDELIRRIAREEIAAWKAEQATGVTSSVEFVEMIRSAKAAIAR